MTPNCRSKYVGNFANHFISVMALVALSGPTGFAADEPPPANAGADCGTQMGDLVAPRPTPTLDKYAIDLVDKARRGKLDPVIGREKEISRMVQILMRRSKNNPVIIGEAGVGKTAVVEGLAHLIASGRAPRALKNKRIVSLNLANLVAGAKFRGEFEDRLKIILKELEGSPNTIVFLDEIHTMVGAGAAEGGMDASNILKPALARGGMTLIGATTIDEYRKHIEKDPALERRFQVVQVDPPSREQTVEILTGLRERFSKHHDDAEITDGAIKLAVELSDRYITNGKNQPDKSLDLLDEAGSVARLRAESATGGPKKPVVNEDTIREVISEMTGIDLRTLDADEAKRLLNMEEIINAQVIGQEPAVSRIARVVRKAKADLKDPKRPIASFLFAGPTGVGKTLLAKKLAKFLFGDEEACFTFDMSEYTEKHNVSRLVGAPPGYVGYEEGGQLTDKVRRRPYSIIVLDEIEKADPAVWNLFLQVMEEGRLTDGMGRVVDFKNTIIIFTTNAGAGVIDAGTGFRLGQAENTEANDYESAKARLMLALKKEFKPEFLNRFNDVIVFRGLNHDNLRKIVEIETKNLAGRLKAKGWTLELSTEAKDFILSKADTVEFGGRALRRSVENWLEEPIAEDLLRGSFTGYTKVKVIVRNNGGEQYLAFEPSN